MRRWLVRCSGSIEEYRLPRHAARADAPAQTASHTDGMPTETATPGSNAHSEQPRRTSRSTKLGKCFRDEDELAASHSLPDSIREALAASRDAYCHLLAGNAGKPLGATGNRDVRAAPRARAHHLRAGRRQSRGKHSAHSEDAPDTRRQRRFCGKCRPSPSPPICVRRLRPSARPNCCASSPPSPAAATTISANASEPAGASALPSRPWQRPSPSPPSASSPSNFTEPARRRSSQNRRASPPQALDSVRPGGDRVQAIETALQALPLFREPITSRPLVPEAQAALENALLALNPDPEHALDAVLSTFETDGRNSVDVTYSQSKLYSGPPSSTPQEPSSLYNAAQSERSLSGTATLPRL